MDVSVRHTSLVGKTGSLKLFKVLTEKRKGAMYTSLSTMMLAGLTLKYAFEVLIEEEKNTRLKETFQQLLQQVIGGKSLAEAFSTLPDITIYETKSIELGEATGKLAKVLGQLAKYYQGRMELKRKVSGAAAYPALILCMTTGVVAGMLIFVVPMYEGMYRQFGQELPSVTNMLVKLSNFLNTHMTITMLGLLGLIILLRSIWAIPSYKGYIQKVMLVLPLIGKLKKKLELGKFMHSLSLLSGSGKPLVESLELTSQMTDFIPLSNRISEAAIEVTRGHALHKSLEDRSVFDQRLVSYVRVGEESGKLTSMFETLTRIYEDEVDHQLTITTRLMEPIMMLMVGCVVGFVVIALYLPMIQLGTI